MKVKEDLWLWALWNEILEVKDSIAGTATSYWEFEKEFGEQVMGMQNYKTPDTSDFLITWHTNNAKKGSVKGKTFNLEVWYCCILWNTQD